MIAHKISRMVLLGNGYVLDLRPFMFHCSEELEQKIEEDFDIAEVEVEVPDDSEVEVPDDSDIF